MLNAICDAPLTKRVADDVATAETLWNLLENLRREINGAASRNASDCITPVQEAKVNSIFERVQKLLDSNVATLDLPLLSARNAHTYSDVAVSVSMYVHALKQYRHTISK